MLASQENIETILLGKDFGDQAAQLAQTGVTCAPKWDLLTVAYLLQKTDLLIAPDTGILHLGDFLGTTTIGLFGPTLASRHGPFLSQKNVRNAIQIPCEHSYQKTHGEVDCMEKFGHEDLWEIARQQLRPKGPSV